MLRKFTCKFKVILCTYSILFVLLFECKINSYIAEKVINMAMAEIR